MLKSTRSYFCVVLLLLMLHFVGSMAWHLKSQGCFFFPGGGGVGFGGF